jgi:hypothetical protein
VPWTARASAGEFCYYAINRGNAGAEMVYKDEDFAAFVWIKVEAGVRVPKRILAYSLPDAEPVLPRPSGPGATRT